uniref:protein-serine/threonine phosphatase n=1 Tax=Amphora coffeiformis TaxID=265554 RepID=A0A7S3LGA8_9STRA|mmetsp:Transcript_15176/g.30866  ORF Transcript_15176/g.30866 Transcript_15176/m.30866 type:complete len:435 (+) Transcript_15176:225-1529(+)|eukprot:scaffold1936_cov154-Amphora_coffeaeformis.AAC.5
MGNLLGSPVTEKETHSGVTGDSLPFAVSSMQGWRVHMEDAHITEGNLYAAEGVQKEDGSVDYTKISLQGHSLFAVYDGHGGTFAAKYAGDNFCRVLSRTAKFIQYAKYRQITPEKEKTFADPSMRDEYLRNGRDLLHAALIDAFVETDKEIGLALRGQKVADADKPYSEENHQKHNSGQSPGSGDDQNQSMEVEGPSLEEEGDSGTTACVVVITPEYIVCANAGDSRAVLCRDNRHAVALSHDHKPDNPDEDRRIRLGGGFVAGGRVEGDLAVSRGLGDFRFKVMEVVMAAEKLPDGAFDYENGETTTVAGALRRPVTKPSHQKVSPVPELIFIDRSPDKDEFVLIACDGIWDVQSNEVAVQLVANLFAEGEADLGLICEEVCDCCLGIGSKDNMTTLVVKLESQKIGTGGGVQARRATRQTVSEKKMASMDST